MDSFKKDWFSECNDLWPGQCFSMQIEKILHKETSEYQDIMVLQTKSHGTALILDGIIQCTERDEFAYQEMIAMLPLCAHAQPSSVLIVGGGDGGVAREVAKHPLVKHITQVEIDGRVIEASKKFLPFMAKGFESPKLTCHVGDGFEYMRQHTSEYDVIITDSSDPIGPAVNLFTESYFQLLKGALKTDGIICSQAGTPWTDLVHIKSTMDHARKYFADVKYAIASVPTYPTGQIGFIVASMVRDCDVRVPKVLFAKEQLKDMDLRYYNGRIHKAAFVLPNFIMDNL